MLCKVSSTDFPMLDETPIVLVVTSYNQPMMTNGHRKDSIDLSIAMSFSMFEAWELGFGTCWMANYEEEKYVKHSVCLKEPASRL